MTVEPRQKGNVDIFFVHNARLFRLNDAVARQVTSSTVEDPEILKRQMHAAIPKPDPPRPSLSDSKGFKAEVIEEEPKQGTAEAAAAAAIAAPLAKSKETEKTKNGMVVEEVAEKKDAIDEDSAEQGHPRPPRYGNRDCR